MAFLIFPHVDLAVNVSILLLSMLPGAIFWDFPFCFSSLVPLHLKFNWRPDSGTVGNYLASIQSTP